MPTKSRPLALLLRSITPLGGQNYQTPNLNSPLCDMPCWRCSCSLSPGIHSLGPRDPLSRTLSSAERGKDTSAAGWGAWPAGYGLCSRCSGRVWGTAVWPGSGRVRRRTRARRGYKRPRAPLRVWRARIRVLQNQQGMAICWLAKLYCWLSFSWRSCWFVEHARAHGPRPLRGTTPRRPLPQLGPGTSKPPAHQLSADWCC